MLPKFFDFVTDQEKIVQYKLIYKNLSKRQKVRWRKHMHRAFKLRTNQTDPASQWMY